MSRYDCPLKEEFAGKYECVVGWDNPEESYFYQVYDKSKSDEEDEGIIAFKGYFPKEIPEITDLVKEIAPWVDFDHPHWELIGASLVANQANSPGPTPHQKHMQELLANLLPKESADE